MNRFRAAPGTRQRSVQPRPYPARSRVRQQVDEFLGLAYQLESRDPPRALTFARRALNASRMIRDPARHARARLACGRLQWRLANLPEARSLCSSALGLFRRLGDRTREARSLNNLANVHSDLAEYGEALRLYTAALELARDTGDSTLEATCLMSIGIVHDEQCDDATALRQYLEALSVYERTGDLLGQARCLNNIGTLHEKLGQRDEARAQYLRARELSERTGDRRVEGYARLNLGTLGLEGGPADEAEVNLMAAASIMRGLGDRKNEGRTLAVLGRLLASTGRTEESVECLETALRIADGIEDVKGALDARLAMGSTLALRGDAPGAIRELERTVDGARRVGLRGTARDALAQLSRLHEAAGDYRSALRYLHEFNEIDRQLSTVEHARRTEALLVRREIDEARRFARAQQDLNEELARTNHALREANEHKERLLDRLRQQADTLAYHARHDALTGLVNRAVFEDRLRQSLASALRHGRSLAVVLIDLDGFKAVNDALGRRAGDEVLLGVARRLAQEVRGGDTVARFGGDEFCVLLTDLATPDDAVGVAERLHDVLAQPVRIDDSDVALSASLGVALFPRDADDADALVRGADLAMYRVKRTGRNGVGFFAPSLDSAAHERLKLRGALARALERGELCLHYQPQYEQAGLRLSGFEALLRWHHPEFGTVPPGEFIPIAEDSGLILPIGRWVLEEACRQVTLWRAAGLFPARVAVNVSPLQFARDDFITFVAELLDRHGLPGSCLELELTERLVITDLELARDRILLLRGLGVEVALDDFGTGHSALGYLAHLPVSTLKLDRSFARSLHQGPASRRIVQAVVAIANAFDMTVVAEGIETEQQLNELSALGCTRAQGFLLGRPEEALLASERLEHGHL